MKKSKFFTTSIFLLSEIIFASIIPNIAQAVTLADLFNGASIRANDKIFAEWNLSVAEKFKSGDTPTVTPIDLSQIDVIPLEDDPNNPGIQYIANNDVLAVSAQELINIQFDYKVFTASNQALIKGSFLALNNFAVDEDGTIQITSDYSDRNNQSLGSNIVAFGDQIGNNPIDSLEFDPQPEVSVSTTIILNTFSDDSSVISSQLTSYEHRFQQVPESGSIISIFLISILGLGSYFSRNSQSLFK